MTKVFSALDLTKKFVDLIAVDHISFDLSEGEILGLLGPNGAGKTTTIQMLLGVLTPTSGRVEFFEKDLLLNREEALEQINFSSTYTNLPWNLTVSDNLNFVSFLYKIPNRKKRLAELIEVFSLEKLLRKRVVLLSAGELTRLNLAKAFINKPRVVLLDEPTASLDPENSKLIHSYILEQRNNFGLSVLFTSHNMTEVERLCDRVVFIEHGKIVANDTPSALSRRFNSTSISLILNKNQQERFRVISNCHNCIGEFRKEHFTGTIPEDNLNEFLKELLNNSLDFSNLTVEKPGLEEYFLNKSNTIFSSHQNQK